MKTTMNFDFKNGVAEIPIMKLQEVIVALKTEAYEEGLEDGKKEREPVGGFPTDSIRKAIREQERKEGYRKGYEDGYEMGKAGGTPKFDPVLHVDNSIYGYVSQKDFLTFNSKEGMMETRRTKPDTWKNAVFVKITPIQENKNEAKN